jgi:hypothetical protein
MNSFVNAKIEKTALKFPSITQCTHITIIQWFYRFILDILKIDKLIEASKQQLAKSEQITTKLNH